MKTAARDRGVQTMVSLFASCTAGNGNQLDALTVTLLSDGIPVAEKAIAEMKESLGHPDTERWLEGKSPEIRELPWQLIAQEFLEQLQERTINVGGFIATLLAEHHQYDPIQLHDAMEYIENVLDIRFFTTLRLWVSDAPTRAGYLR